MLFKPWEQSANNTSEALDEKGTYAYVYRSHGSCLIYICKLLRTLGTRLFLI